MPKDDWIYIKHMLVMSEKAIAAILGKTRPEYDNDLTLQMGLAHFIQIIGEAARRVSLDFQSAHPEILWRQIIGTRHRIVHDYMNIDEDVVWKIVDDDLPILVGLLKNLIDTDL